MNLRVIDKFWSHVDKTQNCWNWTGTIQNGTPVIRASDDHGEFSPRRLSLDLAGKSPAKKTIVFVGCNNPLCVNPEHLFYGDEARFWSKVQKLKDDCWVWTAAQDKDMYGKFVLRKDNKHVDVKAHVYSWFLFVGRFPPIGAQVCHTCDHPYCVNPEHLFLGTTQDNTQDRHNKGRDAKGEKNGSAKLKASDIISIRQSNFRTKELARQFDVSEETIRSIKRRASWQSVL